MYDPRHLWLGENPSSFLTQILANELPPWMDARNYSLPLGPLSLFAVSQNAYNPIIHGSHWQRIINFAALALDLYSKMVYDAFYERFLRYPGYSLNEASVFYKVLVPNNTIVSSVSANLTAKTIAGQYNLDGSPHMDPDRTPSCVLSQAQTVFDFYYGLSEQDTFITSVTGSNKFTTSKEIGVNENGTYQIEWVTLDGIETTNYTHDNHSVTLTIPSTGTHTVNVHYTNYDIYYNIVDNGINVIYFRRPYVEVFVSGTNQGIPSTPDLLPCNIASEFVGVIAPLASNRWSSSDEIGLLLNLSRYPAENTINFQSRLYDSVLYPPGINETGLRNAIATEFGLVNHTVITGATGAVNLSSADTSSLLVNGLPYQYYTVNSPASTSLNKFVLPVAALAPGASQIISYQLEANDGPVVPGLYPVQYTTNLPATSYAAIENIGIVTNGAYIQAPSRPWYSGSLNVWRNGNDLSTPADFIETSTTSFTLTVPASAGEQLQIAYMYDFSEEPVVPLYLADYQYSPGPAIKMSVQYQADNIPDGTVEFAPFTTPPPGVSTDAVGQGFTWTTQITVTNSGTIACNPFNITVTLPPKASLNSNVLTLNNIVSSCDVSWISSELWVKTLSDTFLQDILYTDHGTATNILSIIANVINQTDAVAFPFAKWNSAYWISVNSIANSFDFIPTVFDPDYSYLDTEVDYFGGVLSDLSQVSLSAGVAGSSIAGQTTSGIAATAGAGYTIDHSAGGNAIEQAWMTRYKDFKSGIGYGTDLNVTVASASAILALADNNGNIGTVGTLDQVASVNPFIVSINTGTYYLRQEQNYVFSEPASLVTSFNSDFLSGATLNATTIAYDVSGNGQLTPLRQVFFLDSNALPTLTYQEDLTIDSDGDLETSFNDIINVQILSASDGQIYTISPSSSGTALTVVPSSSATFTVSYQLRNSYIVTPINTNNNSMATNGMYFYTSNIPSNETLVIYETSTDDQCITAMPLHPYYNPKDSGFLYLSDAAQVPAAIKIYINPSLVPANAVDTFTVRAEVTDSCGSAVPNINVTALASYAEGGKSFSDITDQFGNVYFTLTSSRNAQIVNIIASVNIFNGTTESIHTISDTSYVKFYTSLV